VIHLSCEIWQGNTATHGSVSWKWDTEMLQTTDGQTDYGDNRRATN